MAVTSKELLNTLYYKKLPQIYRDKDSEIGEPFKRYLESLIEGGCSTALEDIKGLMLLIDPKSTPEKIFPYLSASFGLEYFPDIEVTYQRKFLLNIGELVKRRGTFSSVHFLIRALTGLESELSLQGDTLSILLLAKTVEQINMVEPSIKIVRNFIKTQIPYYINPDISSNVTVQVIRSKSYSFNKVTCIKSYVINPYKEVN